MHYSNLVWQFLLLAAILASVYWFFRSPDAVPEEPVVKWPEPESRARGCCALPPPPPASCDCRIAPPPLTPADSLSPYEQRVYPPSEDRMKDCADAPPPAPIASRLVIPSRAKKSAKRKVSQKTRK